MFPLQSTNVPFGCWSILAGSILRGLIILFISCFAVSSYAATCSQLGHQLAAVGKSQSGSNKYRKAAQRQLKQLNILKRSMRRSGCFGIGFLNRNQKVQCSSLLNTRNKMKVRLTSLRKKSRAGNHTTNRKHRRIKLQMRRRGCGTQTARIKPKVRKKRSLIAKIYGNIDHDRNRKTKDTEPKINVIYKNKGRSPLKRYFSKGTPVTAVCVRTCDGYHFPVNFSGRRGNFNNASDICRTMCPGAEMALYLRRSSSKSTNNLYSAATGEPYAALPKSFAFQKNFNPNCSCNYNLLNQDGAGGSASRSKQEALSEQNVSEVRTTIPVSRIDRGQDPETMQNLAGGWSLKLVQNLQTPQAKKVSSNNEAKKIRIVGDKYFPGQ